MPIKVIASKLTNHIEKVTAARKPKPIKDCADSTLKARAAKGDAAAKRELKRREKENNSKTSAGKGKGWGNKKPPFPGAAPPFGKADAAKARKKRGK